MILQQTELLHSAGQLSEERVSDFFILVVLCVACLGGVLHGVAMGLRKYYGEGRAQYYLEWRWWLGAGSDALAGLMIWPAMPYVSVHILMPMVVVMQLAASYLLSLLVFKETSNSYSNLGLVFSVVGVVGLSLSTSLKAEPFSIESFWHHWVTLEFLVTTIICLLALAGSFFFSHRSAFWALSSGLLEGVQYVCSRTIAVAIKDGSSSFAVVGAWTIKITCIVLIVHFQQMGLESDLFRFAGIYLVSTTLFICIYGVAYFGDELPRSMAFVLSAVATLTGIWLLNKGMTESEPDTKLSDTEIEPDSKLRDTESAVASS